ncbi:hypothetical protein Vretimale_17222 [Volvox reticuliferus]|uniref:Uncharacterized protein n=1 Tax=Volvox reticuliferus TaxID=1737510 RepID=A0A8J4LY92_9CHLO|nr:hypothetical protein Vretimale_17222 [Volvox reticuliferus]
MDVTRQPGLCPGDVENAGRTKAPVQEMQHFVAMAVTLLENLSECTGMMEFQEAGPTVNIDSLTSATSADRDGLLWTTRLRMVLSQTFGISELRTEILDLVSLGVLYNDALAPLLLQFMVRSLERSSESALRTGGAGGSAGAKGWGRGGAAAHNWGEAMREWPDNNGWDGKELSDGVGAGSRKQAQRSEAACQPLGPTIADLPLALCLYSSCPEKCGQDALRVVATVALLSSPKELSSWFAAYSADRLTQVMDWLLEATLGWLTGSFSADAADYDDVVCSNAASSGAFLQRQRGSSGGAAAPVTVAPVAAAGRRQFLSQVQCGAVLLAAMSWSCPAVARRALAVVLDRLGAADEEEGLKGHDEPFSCAINDVGFRHCGPVWHVLRAITSDMVRVLAVRDRLQALMLTDHDAGGMDLASASRDSGSDRGHGPMVGSFNDQEAVRLVSELCGDDVDLYEHLLCQAHHLIALLVEHVLYAPSMRPAAAIRLVRLMAPLMPHSDELAEMMLLDVANIACEAAGAAAAEDCALNSLNCGEGAVGITSPSRATRQPYVPSASCISGDAGRSLLTGVSPTRSVRGLSSFGMRGTSGVTDMLSPTLRGTSSAARSSSAALLLHHVCRAQANGNVNSTRRDDASCGALTTATDGGHGGVLPSAVLLALEALCAAITHGRRLAASLEPVVAKLLDGLIRLASRYSPFVPQVTHMSHDRSAVDCAATNVTHDMFGTVGDAVSLTSAKISVQIFSRVRAALAAAARVGVTSTAGNDMDRTDTCLLYVAAVATSLRSCVECNTDDEHRSTISSGRLSMEGALNGAGTPTPLQPPPAPPGLRRSLSNCVRWQRARAVPDHGSIDTSPCAGHDGASGACRARSQLRSWIPGFGEVAPVAAACRNLEFVLAAPPVASLITTLGQALGTLDWGPYGTAAVNRGSDAIHPDSPQTRLRDRKRQLDEHVAVLAELLILAAFGDDCVGACQQGGHGCERTTAAAAAAAAAISNKTRLESRQQLQQLAQQEFTDAKAEAVLQMRMQVLAAMIVVLARAPEPLALAVLREAAPLLPHPLQEPRQHHMNKRLPEVVPRETDAVCCVSVKESPGMGTASAIGGHHANGIMSPRKTWSLRQTAYNGVFAVDDQLLAAQSAVRTAVSLALRHQTRDGLFRAMQGQMRTTLTGADALTVPVCWQRGDNGDTVVREGSGNAVRAHIAAAFANGGQRAVSTALVALLSCHGALQDKLHQLAAAMATPTPQGSPVKSVAQQRQVLATPSAAPGTGVTTQAVTEQLLNMNVGVHSDAPLQSGIAVGSVVSSGDSWAKPASAQPSGHRDAKKSGCAGKASGFFVLRRPQDPAAASAAAGIASNQRQSRTSAPRAATDDMTAAAAAAGSMDSVLRCSTTVPGHARACDTLQSKAQLPPPPGIGTKAAMARPILDTWPVPMQVCTQLLQQLLGLSAISPLPRSPASQVWHWRMMAYGANMARRSVFSAAGGMVRSLHPLVGEKTTRNLHAGALMEELVALGNVAVDMALEAALEAGAAKEGNTLACGAGWDQARAPAATVTSITEAREEPGQKAAVEAAGRAGARAVEQDATPGTAALGSNNPRADPLRQQQQQVPCSPPPSQLQSMGQTAAEDDDDDSDCRIVSCKKARSAPRDRVAEPQHVRRVGNQPKVQPDADTPRTKSKESIKAKKMLRSLQDSLSTFSDFKDIMGSASQPDRCRRPRRSCSGIASNVGRDGDYCQEGSGGHRLGPRRTPKSVPSMSPIRPTAPSGLKTQEQQPRSMQPQTHPETPRLQRTKPRTHLGTEQHLRTCTSMPTSPPACKSTGGREGSDRDEDRRGNGDACIQFSMPEPDPSSKTASLLPQVRLPDAAGAATTTATDIAAPVAPPIKDVSTREIPPANVVAAMDPVAGIQLQPGSQSRDTGTKAAVVAPAAAGTACGGVSEMQPGGAASEARAAALQLLAAVVRVAVVCLPSTCEGSPALPQPPSEDASKLTAACSVLPPPPQSWGFPAAAVANGHAAPGGGDAPAATASSLLQTLLQRLYPPSVSKKVALEMLLDAVPHMNSANMRALFLWVCQQQLAVVSLCLLDEARRLLLREHCLEPDPKKQEQQDLGERRLGQMPLVPPAPCPRGVDGQLRSGDQQQRRQCKNGSDVGKVVDALVSIVATLQQPFCSSDRGPRYKYLLSATANACSQMLLCPAEADGGTSLSGKTARLLARLACRGATAQKVLTMVFQVLQAVTSAQSRSGMPYNVGGGGGQGGGFKDTSQPHLRICPYLQRASSRFAGSNVSLAGAPPGDCGANGSIPTPGSVCAAPSWLTDSPAIHVAQVLLELSSAVIPSLKDAAVALIPTCGSYDCASGRMLEDLPAAVAAALTCCLQSCGLLLASTVAAASAPVPAVATQPATEIRATPAMGRSNAKAEEEERMRLLVLGVRQLQAVAMPVTLIRKSSRRVLGPNKAALDNARQRILTSLVLREGQS